MLAPMRAWSLCHGSFSLRISTVAGLSVVCAAVLGCAEPIPIPDVQIEELDTCAVACRVRWTTEQPASSWVHFGTVAGADRFRVGSDEPTTEHDVLVLGLRPGRDHELQAVSVMEDGSEARSMWLDREATWLPFETATIEAVLHDPGRMQPGWTLMNLVVGDAFPPAVAVMIDDHGEVVWYHSMGEIEGFAGIQTSLIDGDQVLIGGHVPPTLHPRLVDLAGEVLWEGPQQPDGPAQHDTLHHTFQLLPDDRFLAMRYELDHGTLKDVVFVFDEDLETAWEWHAGEHIPENDDQSLHGNMAQVDADGAAAYYHSRNLSAMFRFDTATGEILWELGEGRDFTVLGDHEDPWFLRSHGPEILPDGNLLVHDNGSSSTRPYTRIMEYALDQQAMTIEPVWQYPAEDGDDRWFGSVWGDADRLANGNTLFASGSVLDGDDDGRIKEVTLDGDVVWEVTMTAMDGGPAGTYMLERIPALVEELR